MHTNRRRIPALLTGFVFVAAAAASPAPQNGVLGEFAIHNYDVWRTTLDSGKGTISADMTGSHLFVVSPRYRMDAPDIRAIAQKGGKPAQYKVVDATATGGVKILVKDAASPQTTTLTCEKAVYHATSNVADRGRLDLTGHVRSVTNDPALAEPLVQESDSGSVTFPDAASTVIELRNGSITGTPREPAASTSVKSKAVKKK